MRNKFVTHLALGAAFAACSALATGAALPELIQAAKRNDPDQVKALVESGADVKATEGDGSTALHWAAYRNQLELVDLLLKAGADPNASTDLGVTPLWNAALNGSDAIVARLLIAGANPNLALIAGETPLMAAARGGYPRVAELLIGKGADLNRTATRGQTALMWAASEKHPKVVDVLIKAGADLSIRSEEWILVEAVPPHGHRPYDHAIPHGSDTAILFAARSGDVESTKLLLDAGADVDDKDAWGVSNLMYAAHSDFRDVAELLLERGADPNVNDPGFTALHAAIMHRDGALVRALLDHGADPNQPVTDWTPERRTSRDYNFAPELIGATPYWLAAHFLSPDSMRALAEHGADTKVVHRGEWVDLDGKGGFENNVAISNAVLAAAGVGGGRGWNPPERSEAEAVTLETIQLAVENGADINFKNVDGRTALDAAGRLRMPGVLDYLKAQGAESGQPPRSQAGR